MFTKCGIQISDTDLYMHLLHAVLEELQTLATVGGLPYDENMQMESLQCCDNLEGNWKDRLQEDYKCRSEKFLYLQLILF